MVNVFIIFLIFTIMGVSRIFWGPEIQILSTLVVVQSLKLTELIVPKFADRGSSVNLTCKFDLEGALLNSVKWYKDEFEFFRFVPTTSDHKDNKPQTLVFPEAGVNLDESVSGMFNVALTDLSFPSSGNYKCEVSTEAPNFAIDFKNLNMSVLSYPKYDPIIEGIQTSYSEGDDAVLNCTASPSFPAPIVVWYINGVKADTYILEQSPPLLSKDGTYTKYVGLHFRIFKQHFKGPQGIIELRCSATVPGLPPKDTTVNLMRARTLTNQKLAQERHNEADVNYCSTFSLLVAVLLYVLS